MASTEHGPDPAVLTSTDRWLREVRDELRGLRQDLNPPKPASEPGEPVELREPGTSTRARKTTGKNTAAKKR